jgi:hypothetical protein
MLARVASEELSEKVTFKLYSERLEDSHVQREGLGKTYNQTGNV